MKHILVQENDTRIKKKREGARDRRGVEVHTNSIESFWSLLKRGIVGTYHYVSKKYLPLCQKEFSFRYNIATIRRS